ncbi:MAG: hypothetical protein R3B47_01470 [Bacteroidia bacterium]
MLGGIIMLGVALSYARGAWVSFLALPVLYNCDPGCFAVGCWWGDFGAGALAVAGMQKQLLGCRVLVRFSH